MCLRCCCPALLYVLCCPMLSFAALHICCSALWRRSSARKWLHVLLPCTSYDTDLYTSCISWQGCLFPAPPHLMKETKTWFFCNVGRGLAFSVSSSLHSQATLSRRTFELGALVVQNLSCRPLGVNYFQKEAKAKEGKEGGSNSRRNEKDQHMIEEWHETEQNNNDWGLSPWPPRSVVKDAAAPSPPP